MSKPIGEGKYTMSGNTDNLLQTIAHHDAAISTLSGRMTGVEQGLKTLQGEVHAGFHGIQTNMGQQVAALQTSIAAIGSKFDRIDAAPKFDMHRTIRSVAYVASLFALICTGIIYISTSQFSGVIAEQKSFNQTVTRAIERHDQQIDKLHHQWSTTVVPARPAR